MGFPFIGMLLICLFLKQDPTITKAVLKLTMYPGWFPTWDSCVSAFSVMGFQVCATTPGLVGCFLRRNSVVWYALHSVGMFFVSAKGVLCWGTLWATCWASAQEIPLLGIWSCGLVACWGLGSWAISPSALVDRALRSWRETRLQVGGRSSIVNIVLCSQPCSQILPHLSLSCYNLLSPDIV